MNPIQEIADKHNLELIYDMAQAYGTLYDGNPCGSYGRMSTLSFYPTKNLPGIGDGGMVFCRDQVDADRIRKIRGHQAVRMNNHLYTGWNSRLDEIQAIAIRARHSHFADEQADRDQVAAIYDSYIPQERRCQTPNRGKGMKITYHQYWLCTNRRAELQKLLNDEGIDTAVYYDPPMHKHVLGEYCRISGDLQRAEQAGQNILILPIHAALPFEDAHRIGKLVGDFLTTEG